MSTTVWAAGAVVLRERDGRREVALEHRPAYDDWCLPKGKRARDESLQCCAVREVEEETGLVIRLGVPLDQQRYRLPRGDWKCVAWWVATVLDDQGHVPDKEVDVVAWCPVEEALTRLSHDNEREVLRQALEQPATTPVIVLRHGKARSRRRWRDRDDWLRPLARRGRRQARRLVTGLRPWAPVTVTTSTSTRCAQTVEPLATALGATVVGYVELSEERGIPDPGTAEAVVRQLAIAAVHADETVVMCGHRPVLPTMLTALDVVPRPLRTGAFVVAHLDRDGNVVATESVGDDGID